MSAPFARSRRTATTSVGPPFRVEISPDEEDPDRCGSVIIVGTFPCCPVVAVHAGGDDNDLLRRYLVPIDESLLRPIRPHDQPIGAGEARPVQAPLDPFDGRAVRGVPVVEAERVELNRRRIEGNHARDPAHHIGHQRRGDLGVHEKGIEAAVYVQAPAARAAAESCADRPVSESRRPRPTSAEPEVDRHERGLDPRVRCHQPNEVVGVGDVPKGLLEHECDSRWRTHSGTDAESKKERR